MTRPDGRRYLGAGRRLLERALDVLGDGEYTPGSLDPTARPTRVPPALGRIVGWFLLSARQPRRAQRYLESAVRDGDERARPLLARSLLTGGPDSVTRTPTLDLTVGPGGAPAEAAEVLQQASRELTSAELILLAEALQRSGRGQEAEQLLDAVPQKSAAALRLLGTIIEQRGRSRGALTTPEVERLTRIWTESLELETDRSTEQRLIQHLVLHGQFRAARRQSLSSRPAAWRDDIDWHAFRSNGDIGCVTDEWLYAARAECIDLGDFVGAHALKHRLAERVADRPLPPYPPATHVIERTRAVSYARGERAALTALDASAPRTATRVERLMLAKLRADLALASGDLDPLRSIRRALAAPTPVADERFTSLLCGARVLVLGPAPFARPTQREFSEFDVVVTTKRVPSRYELVAGQALIVYKADASALLDEEDQSRATVEVVRPSIDRARWHGRSGRTRVMPAEDTNTFRGTHFGIQRILYDVVGREAREIHLGGIDFFLGPTRYEPGYEREVETTFARRDLVAPRSTAAHDHLWDFRFTQRLVRAGLVHPHADLDAVLALDPCDYLQLLANGTAER